MASLRGGNASIFDSAQQLMHRPVTYTLPIVGRLTALDTPEEIGALHKIIRTGFSR